MSSKVKFNFSWINDCFDTTTGRQLLTCTIKYNLGNGIFQKVMESHGILTGQMHKHLHGNSTNFILPCSAPIHWRVSGKLSKCKQIHVHTVQLNLP